MQVFPDTILPFPVEHLINMQDELHLDLVVDGSPVELKHFIIALNESYNEQYEEQN